MKQKRKALLGLALLLAGATVRDRLDDWSSVLESTPAYVVQVAVGAGLVVLSYALDPKYRDSSCRPPGRSACSPATSSS